MQGSTAYADLERALPGGGDERITIAVLDGPVDLAHPCFAGARLTELQTLAAGSGGGRALAHGTHVASVIFGQPGSAVRGIAPACRGLIAPIFSDSGNGLTCSQLDLARAILLAVEHGAHIINISGGQLSEGGEADSLLDDALAKCEAAGVLVVAAAGNDGCDCVHVPAAVATVLAVGAADRYGAPLAISNWGAAYRANGVLAPGEAIEGALPGGGTVKRTGSSFAAPIVSAFAGLILAQQLARGEEPNPTMARKLLIKGAIKAPPEAAGSGRYLAGGLNPASALGQSNRGRRSIMTTSEAVDTREAQATPYPEAVQHEIAASAAGVSALDADMSVTPSCGGKDCGCGCGGTKSAAAESRPQLVYALGQIGFDFGTESRRDSVAQFMRGKSPTDAKALIKHLASAEGGEDIERLIWTVVLDNTPIYAIQPVGAFANSGYGRILEAFRQQIDLATKRERETIIFAVPGRVAGSVRLMSGETVPVLVPSSRGIIAWDVDAAIKALIDQEEQQAEKDETDEARLERAERTAAMREVLPGFLRDFRNLIMRKYRNLGLLGRERALNFAATSTYRVFDILNDILGLKLILDDIVVLKSPSCRSGSECYDVQLKMFTPSDTTASLHIFQFTLDVSDTIPVNIGDVSSWRERPKD